MREKAYISSRLSDTMQLVLVCFFTFLLFGASYSAGFMQMQMAEEIVEDVDFDFGENHSDNDGEDDDDLKTSLFAYDSVTTNLFADQELDFVSHCQWQHQKKCHPVITPPPELG